MIGRKGLRSRRRLPVLLQAALLTGALMLVPGLPMAVPSCGPSTEGGCSGGPASPSGAADGAFFAGNPINLATGNKYQREVDLAPLPGELGLELVRLYNSRSRAVSNLGANWRTSYDTQLFDRGGSLQLSLADGRRWIFSRDAAQPSLCASDDPRCVSR